MTDEEFLAAIRKLQIGMLYEKAVELVKRPRTKAAIAAYERRLELSRELDRRKRQLKKLAGSRIPKLKLHQQAARERRGGAKSRFVS